MGGKFVILLNVGSVLSPGEIGAMGGAAHAQQPAAALN